MEDEDIEELIRRHDDYQVEVKLGYDLDRSRRKDLYTVEYFFYLPENLDVNDQTYTKKQFYRDMLLYIRFKAPQLTLAQLADDPRSPLQKTREKLATFRRDPTPYNATVLEYELKLLACALKDSLAGALRSLRRALAGKDADALLAETVEKARAVTRAFRAMRPDFEAAPLPDPARSAPGFVDEHMSLLIEARAHMMLQALQRAGRGGSPALTALIEEELAHRRARGYPSIVEEGRDNEGLVYRQSILKKYAAGALHLSVRTEKEGKGLEQIGLALGAGLAMIFASGVAFYTQRIYGTLSLSFFIALVVSYMFKDRLKALAQSYVLRFRSDRVMDLSTDIFDPFSQEKIGECRELVHFTTEDKVDPVVRRLRNQGHVTEIESSWRTEKVLHYVKEIILRPRALDKHSRKTALTDIARFHLRNFLLKMDEPRTDLFVLKDGRSETVPAARVYHVNLLIKFTDRARVRYERVRLVLDQDGIKRVEPVHGEIVPIK